MACHSVFNIEPSSLSKGGVIAQGANNTTLFEASMSQNGRTFQVAVKSFHTAGASASAEEEFVKEVQIAQLASSTCQRVCRLLGCCKLDGKVCLVMSLYTSSAANLLSKSQGPLDLLKVLRMAVEILEGLGELHAQNIWHLDLKPANILLDKYQHAYLADFGISHALQTLQSCTAQTGFIGTPHYMAPEQADADFGSRGSYTDVWGFATTILHLATGELPYNGLSQFQIMTAMIKKRPPTVSEKLPGWLQQLLKQCLSFDAVQRPSVAQLLQEMEQQLLQQQGSCGRALSLQHASLAGAAASAQPTAEQAGSSSSNQIPAMVRLFKSEQAAAAEAFCKLPLGSQQNGEAIPTPGAIPALVGLLKSERFSIQLEAAEALSRLAQGSQMQDAFCKAGAIPALVSLLMSEDCTVQAAAANALSDLAEGSQQIKDAIFAAGAAHALLGLLKSKDIEVQSAAALAFGFLATGAQHTKDAIFAAGAAPALAALLKSEDTSTLAGIALSNLASGSQQNKDAIFAAGALPVLVGLLKSEDISVHFTAASPLCELAAGSQQNKDAIIAADAVPALATLLESDDTTLQHIASQALSNLADLGSQQNKDAIFAADTLPALVGLLKSDYAGVQCAASRALANLATGSLLWKKAIFAADALPALVGLLKSDYGDLACEASRTLAHLANGSQQRKGAIVAAGALPALVGMLKSDKANVLAGAAVTLAELAGGSQQNKNTVIAAGALPALVGLLESSDPDVQTQASRTVAILSGGSN